MNPVWTPELLRLNERELRQAVDRKRRTSVRGGEPDGRNGSPPRNPEPHP
jgi:hypothetical protein